MNPANLKRYATRKYSLKLKQEQADNENFVLNRIKDLLEVNGIDSETAENYINDIFSFSDCDVYDKMTDQEIIEDFFEWK